MPTYKAVLYYEVSEDDFWDDPSTIFDIMDQDYHIRVHGDNKRSTVEKLSEDSPSTEGDYLED